MEEEEPVVAEAILAEGCCDLVGVACWQDPALVSLIPTCHDLLP